MRIKLGDKVTLDKPSLPNGDGVVKLSDKKSFKYMIQFKNGYVYFNKSTDHHVKELVKTPTQ